MRFSDIFKGALVASAAILPACNAVASAPTLSSDVVKQVFQENDSFFKSCKISWQGVQVAGARRASPGESTEVGLPLNQLVYPVFVQYTQNCPIGIRDIRQHYLFYKDDFGKWAMQPVAVSGNYKSDLR